MEEAEVRKSEPYITMKKENFQDNDKIKFSSENSVTDPEIMKSEKHNHGNMVFNVIRAEKNVGKIHVDVKNGNILGGMVVVDRENVTEFHHYNKKGAKESVDKLHKDSLLYLEEMTEEEKKNLGLKEE